MSQKRIGVGLVILLKLDKKFHSRPNLNFDIRREDIQAIVNEILQLAFRRSNFENA